MKRRNRILWATLALVGYYLLFVLFICLFLGGCSVLDRAGGLLTVETESAVVPPPPTLEPDHLELRSAAADFDARVLARVHVEGAPPAAPLVDQATRAAEAVSADVGKPAEPWPLPPPAPDDPAAEFTSVPVVEAQLIDYAEATARARGARQSWERDVTAIAQKPSRGRWSISSPALGTYLLFGIGGLGAALLAVGRWAWKWRKVARQVIPGVQAFLDIAGPDDGSDMLKETLRAATDQDVKVAIDKVKIALGL